MKAPIPIGLRELGRITTKVRKQYSCIVVVFRTGPKKYAYLNTGLTDINKGDIILVPTKSGNDLEATVVLRTNSMRWKNKATKEIIG